MLKLKEVVIVEGKYDKIKLSQIVDALIIDVGGFKIFKDKKKVDLIKKLAAKNGVLILTDSDAAGFMIRNYLTGLLPPDKVKHAYIPDILGKEKRKKVYSKERKLGVEGMEDKIILDAIEKLALKQNKVVNNKTNRLITKLDFFDDGLSGTENSTLKRKKLIKKLNLPEHLSQNALLKILNEIISYDEYKNILEEI
ncbi:MAG: DUF4093 domain-containing protein [Clostridia bacterium]|nr:DUF4093 domain-containing protein [Clostridia bacterium]